MQNRKPRYPGRIKLTEVDAANGIYDMTRADEPEVVGTPLAKKLLDFAVAACGVTAGTSTAYTLDGDLVDGFTLTDGAKVNFKLHVASGANATLNVGGTGAKAVRNVMGEAMLADIPAGTWMSARYSADFDAYVIEEALSDALIDGWNARKWMLISMQESASTVSQISAILPSGYTAHKITVMGSNNSSTASIHATTSNKITGKCTNISTAGAITREDINSGAIKSGLTPGDFYCEIFVMNRIQIYVEYHSTASSGTAAFKATGFSYGANAIEKIVLNGSFSAVTKVMLEGLK